MLHIIDKDKLQKLTEHLPEAKAYLLSDGRINLIRHPECKQEIIPDYRILLSMAKRISLAWERINKIAEQYNATILTPRRDFYGPATKLSYKCNHSDCLNEWSACYKQLNSALQRIKTGRGARYSESKVALWTQHIERGFCPECRKTVSVYKGESKKSQFAKMNSKELLEAARMAPKSSHIKQLEFIHQNGPLYHEMRSRPAHESENASNLFDQFASEFGWRRLRRDLHEWTFEDWCKFLDEYQYASIQNWKISDSFSYKTCRKKGFYQDIKKLYFSKPILLHNGVIYHSIAEVVVAKVLQKCGIKFTAHRAWPFTMPGSRRCMHRDFDFKYKESQYSIEVWMLAEEELLENEKLDEYLLAYLARKEYKIKQIAKFEPETKLISISARKLKQQGMEPYFRHIRSQLACIGISVHFNAEELGFTTTNIDLWSTEIWLGESIAMGWRQISDMPTKFQNYLREPHTIELQTSIAKGLAKHYQYPLNTRYYLAPKQVVLDYIDKRPELWERNGYIKAHTAGQLPIGFPSRPDVAYQMAGWIEIFGVKEFVDYQTAKMIVQKFGFRSRSEFHKARSSIEPQYRILRTIMGCPGNKRSGGYSGEFEGWRTFLGCEDQTPWCHTTEGKQAIQVLSNGSVLSCVRLLKTLGITSKGELRKKSTIAVEALDGHQSVSSIEILAFGKTEHLVTDLKIIISNVDYALFQSEEIWQRSRQKRKALRRFPAKLQRLDPINSESWRDFREWLGALVDTSRAELETNAITDGDTLSWQTG